MELALPPNQKGYRIECACFGWLSFLATFTVAGVAATAEATAPSLDCIVAVGRGWSYVGIPS